MGASLPSSEVLLSPKSCSTILKQLLVSACPAPATMFRTGAGTGLFASAIAGRPAPLKRRPRCGGVPSSPLGLPENDPRRSLFGLPSRSGLPSLTRDRPGAGGGAGTVVAEVAGAAPVRLALDGDAAGSRSGLLSFDRTCTCAGETARVAVVVVPARAALDAGPFAGVGARADALAVAPRAALVD